ncbi:hypothetical protein BGW36DRAFT_442400 [Talaromyces proteolyticus]|uniref:Uncharacterized protein n=1 Tax=Talaromyces proteolyticus TaxID=1131652 RepID=A0AAD4PUD0_9EURO|nr:uncharacterized protein BGW36DRAFT_442400 [Talaromyces proteolyticus]KAH8689163.1 hypothetical protein BGW36DRAFT_442400 [Talaromyces proteolyticus]
MCPGNIQGGVWLDPRHQEWNILVPGLKQRLVVRQLYSRDLCKTRILFQPENQWSAWYRLVRNHTPEPAIRSLPHSPRKLTRFELLPTEILLMVINDASLSDEDLMSIGLTSPIFWYWIIHYIWKDTNREIWSLANLPIACTGSYLEDLPKGFVENDLLVNSVLNDICLCSSAPFERKANWAAFTTYQPMKPTSYMRWTMAFNGSLSRGAGIPAKMLKKLRNDLSSACSPSRVEKGAKKTWVLRNLTEKEYLRCKPPRNSLKNSSAYVDEEALRISIDDILLLKIIWTRFPPFGYRKGLILHHPWAAHAFDIIDLDPREKDELDRDQSWKDITNDIIKEMGNAANLTLRDGATSLIR